MKMKSLQKKFIGFWPQLLSEIASNPELKEVPAAVDWLKLVMESNVRNGELKKGLAMLSFYSKLVENPDDSNLPLIAGWMFELIHTASLMADDMKDEISAKRRGDQCWHKKPKVGACALNDCFMLENLAHFLCYKYFMNEPYFERLLKLVHDISLKMIMGQSLETRCAYNLDLKNCTQETYEGIVAHKTSFYSFYGPLAMAMTLANITDESIYTSVEDVTSDMGYLSHAQEDFLDCYGDPKVTGKIGTHIEDGKCTWLLVKALEIVTPEQYEKLKVCYGSKAEEDQNTVKEIYSTLGMNALFNSFEKDAYAAMMTKVNAMPDSLPKQALLESEYVRQTKTLHI